MSIKHSIDSIPGLVQAEVAQDALDIQLDLRLDALENTTWQDIIGDVSAKTSGATAPTLAALRGGNYQAWFYAAGNNANFDFHFPHDIVPNSDVFLHLHWGHNGAAIGGNLVIRISMTWAKGHNQATFPVEKVFNITIPATNLTVAPRWGHVVSEIQVSAATPTTAQYLSSIIEPDGKLLINASVVTNPTITGGTTNTPYWLGFDVHYKSTNHGTKNKAPNFYL
jgi:hypothetical protein